MVGIRVTTCGNGSRKAWRRSSLRQAPGVFPAPVLLRPGEDRVGVCGEILLSYA